MFAPLKYGFFETRRTAFNWTPGGLMTGTICVGKAGTRFVTNKGQNGGRQSFLHSILQGEAGC